MLKYANVKKDDINDRMLKSRKKDICKERYD